MQLFVKKCYTNVNLISHGIAYVNIIRRDVLYVSSVVKFDYISLKPICDVFANPNRGTTP